MPQRVTAVHPHTEHEQKALQRILAKVCQLAHDVHGQMLCQPRLPQAAQDDAHPRQHPAAGARGDRRHRHGVGKDEPDASDECNGKDHTSRNDPQRGAFRIVIAFHSLNPEP